MLSLKEIREKSLYRIVINNRSEVVTLARKDVYKSGAISKSDPLKWKDQPKEVQTFWKLYEYVTEKLERKDLIVVEDFYNELIKDPHQFDKHNKVLDTLLNFTKEKKKSLDLLVENYDGYYVGEHHVGDFYEAVSSLGIDFEIIKIEEQRTGYSILIQEDDEKVLNELSYKTNAIADSHDRVNGDGKYWNDNGD